MWERFCRTRSSFGVAWWGKLVAMDWMRVRHSYHGLGPGQKAIARRTAPRAGAGTGSAKETGASAHAARSSLRPSMRCRIAVAIGRRRMEVLVAGRCVLTSVAALLALNVCGSREPS